MTYKRLIKLQYIWISISMNSLKLVSVISRNYFFLILCIFISTISNICDLHKEKKC